MKEESKKTSKLYSLFFIPIVFVFLFEIVFLKIDDERFINFLENLISIHSQPRLSKPFLKPQFTPPDLDID